MRSCCTLVRWTYVAYARQARLIGASLVLAGIAGMLPPLVRAQPADSLDLTALALSHASVPAVRAGGQEVTPEGGGFHSFVHDVWSDYRNFLSVDNAEWAAVGSTVTLVAHSADEVIRTATQGPTPTALKAGSTYGNLSFQFPLAATWWIIGHAAGSPRGTHAGRDLVRAQISAVSWTYAIKYAVDRTRPNGDPRSFPSGHTSAAFASAMVLQQHYGWKLGLPLFAGAAYTAGERITDDKHWASDVVFGAVVGVLAGRTVTLGRRGRAVEIQPQAVPGGGLVTVRVLR